MAPGRQSAARPLGLSLPLPMIVEDAVVPPAIPAKSPRRLTANGTGSMTPKSPSSAPQSSEGSVPDRTSDALEKGLREHKWIAKRGGWYRLVLGTLLVLGLIIGLAVGLTIGLRDKNHTPPPPALPTGIFPAGSYSFTTALTRTSTDCTANPSAWRCFPFSTFTPSAPNLSAATFDWIIQPVTTSSYTISSSANPFAPSFASVPLTLLDGNQYTERFTFRFAMNRAVTPSAPLDSSNGAATCYFNETIMSATIWTRVRASYPADIVDVAAPVNATNVFAPWPFAVEVKQVAGGPPECRDAEGRVVGGELKPAGEGAECRCGYVNHGEAVGGGRELE